MKFSDGLFLSCAREVAKEYPSIEFEDRIVDNMSMQLDPQKSQQFDVIVAPNLYGDILPTCARLVGRLGAAPGANLNNEMAILSHSRQRPKYAGMNKVNPMAMMLSGVLLLRYVGEKDAADRLEKAIAGVIADGKDVTYDFKPDAQEKQLAHLKSPMLSSAG